MYNTQLHPLSHCEVFKSSRSSLDALQTPFSIFSSLHITVSSDLPIRMHPFEWIFLVLSQHFYFTSQNINITTTHLIYNETGLVFSEKTKRKIIAPSSCNHFKGSSDARQFNWRNLSQHLLRWETSILFLGMSVTFLVAHHIDAEHSSIIFFASTIPGWCQWRSKNSRPQPLSIT